MKFSRSTATSAALALITTGAIGAVGVVTAPAAMAATYEVVGTLPSSVVGTQPRGLAFNSTGTTLYVAAAASNRLNVIDVATQTQTASVAVGNQPFWVAVSPDNARAYVSNYTGLSVSVINTGTNSVARTVPLAYPPLGVTTSPDDTVYVALDGQTPGPNYVGIFNGGTSTTLDDSVLVDFGTISIAYADNTAPADDTIVIANQDGDSIQTINAATNTLDDTIETRAASGPWGVAITPDRSKYYVTLVGDDSVVRIDAATNTIDDTIGVGDGPDGLALSSDGSRLYVANYTSGSVSIINTATSQVIQTVPVGSGALAVAVHPTNGDVYVSNLVSNTVSIIRLVSPPPPPPAEPPGPPVNVGGVPGDRQVAVAWDPPSSSGSFPVSTYQVETRPYDEEPISNSCLATAPALTCTVTGLTNGKPYVFRVRALSGAGWGPWSKESPQITPKSPSEPTYAIIKDLPTNKRSTWPSIAVNGNSDAVYVTDGSATGIGPQSILTFDGASATAIGSITVGNSPQGMAVDQTSGKLYVPDSGTTGNYAFKVAVIDGATQSIVASVPVSDGEEQFRPLFAAANNRTGKVYVSGAGTTLQGPVFVIDGQTNRVLKRVYVPYARGGIAVDQADDSVYVANNGTINTISVIDGRTDTVAIPGIKVGPDPYGVAIDQTDDTVFVSTPGVAPMYDRAVAVVSGRTQAVSTVQVGQGPWLPAVDSLNHVVYMPAIYPRGELALMDSRTGRVLHTMTVANARAAAVDELGSNAGIAYVARGRGDVAVIATVIPDLTTREGKTGDTVILDVDIPQASYLSDDSTVTGITFGGVRATILGRVAGKDQWRVQVPEGNGTVPVVVTFNGGLKASAGPYTIKGDPTPKEPRDVTGEPGDGEVTVKWKEPESPGDSPITEYEVVTEPGGKTCTVAAPTLTCKITGLPNGVPYTFKVRAKNGSGWGPYSNPSTPVTPKPESLPTYAVIKELATGRNAWGVAVNNSSDAVYVTNRDGRSVSTYDGRSGTPASTITVGDTPIGVAVNQSTGGVYVANFGVSTSPYTRTLVKIDGATGTISGSIPLTARPYSVAINDRTNTIYATSNTSVSGGSFFIVDGDTDSVIKRLTLPSGEGGVAVDRIDDTVYVANPFFGANSVSVIDGRTNELSGNPIKVGVEPTGVAIDQTDDTVFVTNRGFSNNGTTMSVINTRTRDVGSVTVGKAPLFLAVDSANHLAYVPNLFSGTVSMADTRTQVVKHTMTIESPRAVAVDEAGPNAGIAYVTRGGNKLAVVAGVDPTLTTRIGAVGDVVVVDVDVPQAAYLVDDSTVIGVTFAGVPATILGRVPGKDQWQVRVPSGTGTVQVDVTFNGGLSAPAGPYTITGEPTPKEPRDVGGTPGDGEVTVTWKEPESPGDSPITEYEVVSEPDGKTCTVAAPTLTCKIPGLRNGIPYTFKVRAKNGSGWGPYSKPSPVIIPVGPVPQPGTPGVPRDVNETPGPQEILVTWKEPEDPGDGPILEYVATVYPSGKTCRVPAPQLSCRIPGLEDGVPYEVTVVAINRNGAGQPTPPGSPVTPAADASGIVITGDRNDARKPNGIATVSGLTTGIPAGVKLTAYTRTNPEGDFTAGAQVTVQADGTFTWKREVKRGKDLQVYFTDEVDFSNTLVLPARTITITGSRDNSTVTRGKNRVTIKGTSVNVPAGTKLVAKVTTKRGGPYTDGVTVTVAADGTFTWKRNVNKRKTLWVYFIGGKAISNTLKFLPKQ